MYRYFTQKLAYTQSYAIKTVYSEYELAENAPMLGDVWEKIASRDSRGNRRVDQSRTICAICPSCGEVHSMKITVAEFKST